MKVSALAAVAMSTFLSQIALAADRTAPIKVGVLTDMGGAYSDNVGRGSVIAAEMAIVDVGGKIGNLPIDLIFADMQNKVDVSTSIARSWIERDGVDIIMDVPISSGSLAVSDLVKQKDKILISAAGTTELTGKACNRNTIQWTWDNYAMASSLTQALIGEGAKTWSYITVNYTFGLELEALSRSFVDAGGGRVINSVRLPLGTMDQSSAILNVTSSQPQVIGLANGGTDTQTSVKQLAEYGFGASGPLKIAAFTLSLGDIKAIGLSQMAGLYVAMPFYWDLNDATRAWSRRFMERSGGKAPSYHHAGVYSSLMHYFKALKEGSSQSGAAVVDTMKRLPVDDLLFGKGELRADGRKVHPMYLFRVKAPGEAKGEWDSLNLVTSVAADKSFRSLADGKCSLVKASN